MADKYLSFKFGDKHLNDSTWNGFISREDLNIDIPSAPEFDDEYSDSGFGSTNYFLGTNISQRTFNFHIVLNPITLTNYRKFLNWLSVDAVGDLVLDFNTDWKYLVKVSEIGETSIIPVADNKYIVELDVSFTTIYDWAAVYNKSETIMSIKGQDINPILDDSIYISNDGIITIINKFNLPMYLIFNFEFDTGQGIDTVTIEKNENNIYNTIYKINRSSISTEIKDFSIYTKYGFILDSTNNFIKSEVNIGVFKIEPNATDILKFTYTGDNLKIATMQAIIRERF